MKNILRIILTLTSVGTFASIPPTALNCMICHGPNGNSIIASIPKIAGLQESYIENELYNFKDGSRHDELSHVMKFETIFLSKKRIARMAHFFSSQGRKKIEFAPERDPELIAKGKDIFENGIPESDFPRCIGCHSGQGRAPIITRQHSAYIVEQFEGFKNGTRGDAPTMIPLSKKIDNESIQAVSYYLESL